MHTDGQGHGQGHGSEHGHGREHVGFADLGDSRQAFESRNDVSRQAQSLYSPATSMARLRACERMQQRLMLVVALMGILGEEGLNDVLRKLKELEGEVGKL